MKPSAVTLIYKMWISTSFYPFLKCEYSEDVVFCTTDSERELFLPTHLSQPHQIFPKPDSIIAIVHIHDNYNNFLPSYFIIMVWLTFMTRDYIRLFKNTFFWVTFFLVLHYKLLVWKKIINNFKIFYQSVNTVIAFGKSAIHRPFLINLK